MGFSGLDYIVLTLYLAATAVYGILLGRGQRTVRDYFLGDRRMSWWAISLSIVATETSTLTFIGAPAVAFSGNMTFILLVFGYLLGKLLVTLILIPGYFRHDVQTAYELLNFRFGPRTRHCSAFIFLMTRVLADGVRLYATALVLSVVLDISEAWTVLIIALITIVYTLYGGIRAVVWNDVAQLIIYLGGAILAFSLIWRLIPGGWDQVALVAQAHGKFVFLDFSLDPSAPYTVLAGLIGGACLTFATHGTDQMMVQRYLACGDRFKSQVALMTSGVVVLAQFLLFLLIGVELFAYYQIFPMGRELGHPNEVFPIFIVDRMPSGVSGLIIAAIFAAAMSTLSSSLNSLASSSVNDFYRGIVRDRPEQHYLKTARIMTLAWGGVLATVSMLAGSWGELMQAGLAITSFTMGSILGVFLLGLSPKIDQRSALVGMTAGLVTISAVAFASAVAWPWYVLIGTAATWVVGSLTSRWLPQPG